MSRRRKAPAPDKATVKKVQARLLELGYYDGGPVDGEYGPKTQDELLAVSRALGLIPPPILDDKLLAALETAPQKAAPPPEQSQATAADIAPKVEAVAAAASAVQVSWWSRLTSWVFGIPSAIILFVGQIDSVIPIITSIRGMFSEVPWQAWLAGFVVLCAVFAVQAHLTARRAKQAQDAMVDGYQIGTVKNDVPEAKA